MDRFRYENDLRQYLLDDIEEATDLHHIADDFVEIARHSSLSRLQDIKHLIQGIRRYAADEIYAIRRARDEEERNIVRRDRAGTIAQRRNRESNWDTEGLALGKQDATRIAREGYQGGQNVIRQGGNRFEQALRNAPKLISAKDCYSSLDSAPTQSFLGNNEKACTEFNDAQHDGENLSPATDIRLGDRQESILSTLEFDSLNIQETTAIDTPTGLRKNQNKIPLGSRVVAKRGAEALEEYSQQSRVGDFEAADTEIGPVFEYRVSPRLSMVKELMAAPLHAVQNPFMNLTPQPTRVQNTDFQTDGGWHSVSKPPTRPGKWQRRSNGTGTRVMRRDQEDHLARQAEHMAGLEDFPEPINRLGMVNGTHPTGSAGKRKVDDMTRDVYEGCEEMADVKTAKATGISNPNSGLNTDVYMNKGYITEGHNEDMWGIMDMGSNRDSAADVDMDQAFNVRRMAHNRVPDGAHLINLHMVSACKVGMS